MKGFEFLNDRKGQMAIFVIIAILIVAGIITFVMVKNNLGVSGIPRAFVPVYDAYDSCIKEKTGQAIEILGTQGGRIDTGTYIPGSEYAPSSNQLNFLGNPIPYWFYITGNGLIKENVPLKKDMQKAIADYVSTNIASCDYSSFLSQGIVMSFGAPTTTVTINDANVQVDVSAKVSVSNANESAVKEVHSVQVSSSFGKLYLEALSIYSNEKVDSFLENYGVDVLRLYAPVDGVEASCSAKIWKTKDVVNGLKTGLEANIAAIKFKGNEQGVNKYFVVDNPVSDNVNMIYSSNWPTKVEIYGDTVDNTLMSAVPMGNDMGLGAIGFCYAPYHFVYDLSFPVLVQVYNDNEIFQFPVIVVIDKNLPRKGDIPAMSVGAQDVDFCKYKNQDITVNLYDINLNNVDGNLYYKCLNEECYIGNTSSGSLTAGAPQCVNGYIIARSDGYAEKKELLSTNEQTSIDLILDRVFNASVRVFLGSTEKNTNAFVSFENIDTGKIVTAVLPDNKNVLLSEGAYSVKAYVYSNSSLTIPESKKTQCNEVPKSGLFGIFGGTEQKCVDVTIPSAKIEQALIGGGTSQTYFLPEDLQKGEIKIVSQQMPVPTTLEQLQYNFESFDSSTLFIS
jgi:hypothetical protein